MMLHRYSREILRAVALLLVGTSTLFAQRAGDENWDTRFGESTGGGVNDEVFAVAVGPGGLYVGGTFLEASFKPVNHIAQWDGNSWTHLGNLATGFGVDGPVFAILAKGDSVIVGGQFTKAGNVAANNIAVWNRVTNTWSPFGEGLTGGERPYVSSLARLGDSIYVGGQFTTAGAVRANNVALWTGSAWTSLGQSQNNGVGGTVNAVAVYGRYVYVGGNFSTAGTRTASGIARFDGIVWSGLGAGVDGYINALAVNANGALFIGGSFTSIDKIYAPNIAMWTGSEWNALPGIPDSQGPDTISAVDGVVRTIVVDGSSLFVGGTFGTATPGGISSATINVNYVAYYDGFTSLNHWVSLKRGLNGYVNALAVAGRGQIYAGGAFTKAGDISANHIAFWNGREWLPIGTTVDNIVRGIAVVNNNLYIGWSTSLPQGGETRGRIAVWDEGQWKRIGLPLDGDLYAMTSDGNDIIVGGNFATAGQTVAVNVARINTVDTIWRAFNKGSGVAGGDISFVRTIAVKDDNVYFGGSFNIADTLEANNIAVFNKPARRWDSLGAGLNGPVYAIAAADNGDIFAAGEFLLSGRDAVNRVARWDGTRWTPLGGGANKAVNAIAVSGDNIFIGGDFDSVDGRPMNHVAAWNSALQSWGSLGDGIGGRFTPTISAMAVAGRYLYVAGYFESAGGDSAFNIARWDGYRWASLGSGTNSNILAMIASDREVYIGGSFTMTGPVPSFYLGLWHEPITSVDAVTGAGGELRLRGAPNPASESVVIAFHAPSRERASIRIMDMQGMEALRVMESKEVEAGNHSVNVDLSGLAAGVYVCRAQCGDRLETIKLTVVR